MTATHAWTGYQQSLTVIAIQGTNGTGVAVATSSAGGSPAATLSTSGPGSLVFGVAFDRGHSTARTPGPNQSLLHQWLDPGTGIAFWSQYITVPAGPASTAVNLNATGATGDRYDFAAVEIRRRRPDIRELVASHVVSSDPRR